MQDHGQRKGVNEGQEKGMILFYINYSVFFSYYTPLPIYLFRDLFARNTYFCGE